MTEQCVKVADLPEYCRIAAENCERLRQKSIRTKAAFRASQRKTKSDILGMFYETGGHMKFKDKNGNVFEDILDAYKAFYCGLCGDCPLGLNRCNKKWLLHSPAEAARLMGYEVVEDDFSDINKIEEANMEKVNDAAGGREAALGHKQKPLDQWTLGELKEYCVSGVGKNDCLKGTCPFKKICDCIESHNEEIGYVPGNWDLTAPPRFTEEEVADARVLARALLADGFERDKNGDIFTTSSETCRTLLDSRMFPSIRPGQSVELSEIVGGEP